MFTKRSINFIQNKMSLCLSDLENKITQDAPCHLSFFNELFDLLSQLKAPYPYDSKNWADPNNEKIEYI